MGPLTTHRRVVAITEFVRDAQSKGANVEIGGKISEAFESGYYFEPTVITGVPQDSRLIQEEIFGPVLTVQTFQSEDEALALLNGTPYGLSCSVFTRDLPRAQRMARGLGMASTQSWQSVAEWISLPNIILPSMSRPG